MTKKTVKPVADEVLEAESAVGGEKRMYEVMLILKPDMIESNLKKKLGDFKKYLEEHGCRITGEDIWEKRRLAYKIRQYSEGIYVVYNFEGLTPFLYELENHLRIDNDVIRHLVTKLPEGYKYVKFREEPDEEKPASSGRQTFRKEKPVMKKASEETAVKPAHPAGAKETVTEETEKRHEKEGKAEDEKKEKKSGLFSKLLGKTKKDEKEAEEKPAKEPVEEIDRNKLDEKLDKLLGGDDLNI
jgi:small subunit ribosomal protein S6